VSRFLPDPWVPWHQLVQLHQLAQSVQRAQWHQLARLNQWAQWHQLAQWVQLHRVHHPPQEAQWHLRDWPQEHQECPEYPEVPRCRPSQEVPCSRVLHARD